MKDSTIQQEFASYFEVYKKGMGKDDLAYVITSTDRQGNKKRNPHAVSGNAMDFTLRIKGDYAPIKEYNDLVAYLFKYWPYRAGVDNTWGNIHIHVDLGKVTPPGQELPFFFKEDNEIYVSQIKKVEDIA